MNKWTVSNECVRVSQWIDTIYILAKSIQKLHKATLTELMAPSSDNVPIAFRIFAGSFKNKAGKKISSEYFVFKIYVKTTSSDGVIEYFSTKFYSWQWFYPGVAIHFPNLPQIVHLWSKWNDGRSSWFADVDASILEANRCLEKTRRLYKSITTFSLIFTSWVVKSINKNLKNRLLYTSMLYAAIK